MRPLPPRLAPAILLAVAAITWWPALQCGFVWGDDDYVTRDPLLRTWGGLLRAPGAIAHADALRGAR